MQVRGVPVSGKWTKLELVALHRALEPLPDAWLSGNDRLSSFVREDVLRDAPASAPGHSKYDQNTRQIVIYDKGAADLVQFRRSVYHELAHSILHSHPGLLRSFSGATASDGFVDEYAKTSPEEDFADTFSEVLLYPGRASKAVPLKTAFIHRMIDQARGEVKEAMTRFVAAFDDEIEKTAAPGPGLLSRLGSITSRIPKSGLARGLGIAGLAGGGSYAFGRKKGEAIGLEEGTAGLEQGMQQAYVAGVQRGAHAMLQRIQENMNAPKAG